MKKEKKIQDKKDELIERLYRYFGGIMDRPKGNAAILRKALRDFQASEQKAGDYLLLLMAGHNITRQGSGMLWRQMLEILREELE